MLDLIQVFHQIDASCGYKLSQGRFLKEKRQWAREVIRKHLNDSESFLFCTHRSVMQAIRAQT